MKINKLILVMAFSMLSAGILSAGEVSLEWDANTESDLAGYKIYYGTMSRATNGSAPDNYTLSVDAGLTSTPSTPVCTISSLTEGLTYYFSATAYDTASNESTLSDEEISLILSAGGSVTLTSLIPPSVPGNLQATYVTQTRVDLSWDASTDDIGVNGYKIFRDNVQIAVQTKTTYSDTNLTAGAVYSYEVLCYDVSGNESARSALSVTTLTSDTSVTDTPGLKPYAYPIPFEATKSQKITIANLPQEAGTRLEIYSMDGTLLIDHEVLDPSYSFAPSDLVSGVYLYLVKVPNKSTVSGKFIIIK